MTDHPRNERSGDLAATIPEPPTRASADTITEVLLAERHLGRTENKVNIYTLLYGGIVLAGLTTIPQLHLPTYPAVAAWTGVAVFAYACAMLARAVRPSFKTQSGHPYGIALYATLTVDEIPGAVHDAYTTPVMGRRLIDTSISGVSKYNRITAAVDLAWVGVAFLALAGVLALAAWFGAHVLGFGFHSLGVRR